MCWKKNFFTQPNSCSWKINQSNFFYLVIHHRNVLSIYSQKKASNSIKLKRQVFQTYCQNKHLSTWTVHKFGNFVVVLKSNIFFKGKDWPRVEVGTYIWWIKNSNWGWNCSNCILCSHPTFALESLNFYWCSELHCIIWNLKRGESQGSLEEKLSEYDNMSPISNFF